MSAPVEVHRAVLIPTEGPPVETTVPTVDGPGGIAAQLQRLYTLTGADLVEVTRTALRFVPLVLWVDEDGLARGQARNLGATVLAARRDAWVLRGPVVVTGTGIGEDDMASLDDELVAAVIAVANGEERNTWPRL